jgi:hypothetical protein
VTLADRLELYARLVAARADWREIEQLADSDDDLDDGWFVQTRLAMLAARDELDHLLAGEEVAA